MSPMPPPDFEEGLRASAVAILAVLTVGFLATVFVLVMGGAVTR